MYERCVGCKHLESATIFDVSIDFWPVQWFIGEGLHHVHVWQFVHRALIYIQSTCVSTYYLHMHINVRIYLLLIIYQNHRIYYSSHANIALYELISIVVHLLHVIPYYPRYIIIDV